MYMNTMLGVNGVNNFKSNKTAFKGKTIPPKVAEYINIPHVFTKPFFVIGGMATLGAGMSRMPQYFGDDLLTLKEEKAENGAIVTKNSKGEIVSSHLSELDENGNKKTTNMDHLGNIYITTVDKDGNTISQIDKDKKGNLISSVEYSFDDNGTKIATVTDRKGNIERYAIDNTGNGTKI